MPLHRLNQTFEFAHRGLRLDDESGQVFRSIGNGFGDLREAPSSVLDVSRGGIQVGHDRLQLSHCLIGPGQEIRRFVRQAGIGEQLAYSTFACLGANGNLIQVDGELIEALAGLFQIGA